MNQNVSQLYMINELKSKVIAMMNILIKGKNEKKTIN